MNIVRIAMDGPAGAGKSTIAKRVARELGIDYIDTGAMYRAFALKILRTGTDVNDADALAALLKDTDVDYAGGSIFLDGENVDGLIRTPEVSEMASVSSAVQAVRDKLVAAQQAMGKRKSLVMDGRDIGSKVFPDAELKFYITASSRIRAERRAIDMELAGQPCDVDQIQKDIEEIDTTDASLEESVAEVMHYINKFLSKEDQGE